MLIRSVLEVTIIQNSGSDIFRNSTKRGLIGNKLLYKPGIDPVMQQAPSMHQIAQLII